MKTPAPRIAQALRRNPLAVERLLARWIDQGRADAIAGTADALPKAARAAFLRLATFVACVAPLSSDEEGEGVGWLLAFPTVGTPDREALAQAIGEAADPRLWSLTLAARPWDAAALRQAGPPAWRAALEALLDDQEIPAPVPPARRQIWLLAVAGPAGEHTPFPGADVWGQGGLAQRRLAPLLERFSQAAGVPVLAPSLLPDVLDWTAGADALDALADAALAGPEDGQIHVCERPVPEAVVTDAHGRPLRRIDLAPALAAGLAPPVVLGRLLSLDAGPTPVLHRSADTLPRPGWLH